MLLATGTGAMHISPMQVIAILLRKISISVPVSYDPGMEGVLLVIRLPRVLLGVLTVLPYRACSVIPWQIRD
jgi:iron complex transport system permease protein